MNEQKLEFGIDFRFNDKSAADAIRNVNAQLTIIDSTQARIIANNQSLNTSFNGINNSTIEGVNKNLSNVANSAALAGSNSEKLKSGLNFAAGKLGTDQLAESVGFLTESIDTVTEHIGGYSDALREVSEKKKAAQAAQAALAAAEKAGTATTQLYAVAQETAAAATTATANASSILKTALASIGIGILITAVGLLISHMDDLNNMFKKTNKEMIDLNGIRKEANKEVAKEITQLNLLYTAATNTNISLSERTNAVKKLKEEYPSYFGSLKNETILNSQATKQYMALSNAIMQSAIARAAATKAEESAGRLLDKREKSINNIKTINEAIAKQQDAINNNRNMSSSDIESSRLNIANLQLEKQKEANKYAQEYLKTQKEIQLYSTFTAKETDYKAEPVAKETKAATTKDNNKQKKQLEIELQEIYLDASKKLNELYDQKQFDGLQNNLSSIFKTKSGKAFDDLKKQYGKDKELLSQIEQSMYDLRLSNLDKFYKNVESTYNELTDLNTNYNAERKARTEKALEEQKQAWLNNVSN